MIPSGRRASQPCTNFGTPSDLIGTLSDTWTMVCVPAWQRALWAAQRGGRGAQRGGRGRGRAAGRAAGRGAAGGLLALMPPPNANVAAGGGGGGGGGGGNIAPAVENGEAAGVVAAAALAPQVVRDHAASASVPTDVAAAARQRANLLEPRGFSANLCCSTLPLPLERFPPSCFGFGWMMEVRIGTKLSIACCI